MTFRLCRRSRSRNADNGSGRSNRERTDDSGGPASFCHCLKLRLQTADTQTQKAPVVPGGGRLTLDGGRATAIGSAVVRSQNHVQWSGPLVEWPANDHATCDHPTAKTASQSSRRNGTFWPIWLQTWPKVGEKFLGPLALLPQSGGHWVCPNFGRTLPEQCPRAG
jgi:hypothetical protein